MTIKEMKSILETNKFDNYECNFKLKTGKPKVTLESLSHTVESLSKTLKDVIIEMRQGFAKQEQLWAKQEQFNKQMLEFKDYVLDVFKRNNLK